MNLSTNGVLVPSVLQLYTFHISLTVFCPYWRSGTNKSIKHFTCAGPLCIIGISCLYLQCSYRLCWHSVTVHEHACRFLYFVIDGPPPLPAVYMIPAWCKLLLYTLMLCTCLIYATFSRVLWVDFGTGKPCKLLESALQLTMWCYLPECSTYFTNTSTSVKRAVCLVWYCCNQCYRPWSLIGCVEWGLHVDWKTGSGVGLWATFLWSQVTLGNRLLITTVLNSLDWGNLSIEFSSYSSWL
jgi:hypothetical protein